jgi:hypothetical protein
MPIIQAGLFILMTGSAFILMLLSFRIGALLKVLSAVLFFSLALILMAGYEVAYTSVFTGGAGQGVGQNCTQQNPCVQQHFLIMEDTTTGETNGTWIAWVFIALGILASMMFIIEMLPKDQDLGVGFN